MRSKVRIVHFTNAVEGLLKQLLGGGGGPVVPKTTHPLLCELSERLGVDIITDYDCDEPMWSFRKLTQPQKEYFGKILFDELAIYSRDVIRSASVQRIYLCTHLTSPHEEDGGHAAAFTDMSMFAMNSLVLQLSSSAEYIARTIHHELFHAIDYSDDLWHYADPKWKKLAEPGFLYDREMNFQPERGGNQECFTPGFTTTYSRMAVHEDKAELYASMILNYGYVSLRAAEEPVMARKFERMKELLAEFHPEFDEQFWQLMNARSYAPKTYRDIIASREPLG